MKDHKVRTDPSMRPGRDRISVKINNVGIRKVLRDLCRQCGAAMQKVMMGIGGQDLL